MTAHRLTREERVRALEEKLQVHFSKPELALSSLTHTSYVNEHPTWGLPPNERLEFLGDAVVDLAISHRLMVRFPAASEGELTPLRALVVSEEGLARVARRAGLGALLLLGRGEERSGGRERPSLLANALEAVLGALYLSDGLPEVMSLVDRLFAGAFEELERGVGGGDFKTQLQVLAQARYKATPKYRLVSESGPAHARRFELEVMIGTKIYARASGRSKQEAEQTAAHKTLRMLSGPLGEP